MISKVTSFLILIILYSCSTTPEPSKAEIKGMPIISVGVFDGNGAGIISVIETIEALKIDKEINAFPISASDIIDGKLQDIDALIFPGGSGSKQLNNLGKKGKLLVKDFIEKQGKGVLGICAGAYMLCSTEGYASLQVADVKHIDRAHYARGRGLVEFALNEQGLGIFPELKDHNQFVQYYDGPVMQRLNDTKQLTKLAEYVTDIHPNKGTPEGLTPGHIFIYNEIIGKGRIFAIAGHAESTPGMRWMIPRMIRWVTNSELVSYNEKWIKPNQYKQAILFDAERKAFEKKTWWQLFDNNPDIQIIAMDTLFHIHSRPAVRWNIGLLRDTNPKVRTHAAELLQKAEYTDALKDLKTSLSIEQNSDAKKSMENTINFFEN